MSCTRENGAVIPPSTHTTTKAVCLDTCWGTEVSCSLVMKPLQRPDPGPEPEVAWTEEDSGKSLYYGWIWVSFLFSPWPNALPGCPTHNSQSTMLDVIRGSLGSNTPSRAISCTEANLPTLKCMSQEGPLHAACVNKAVPRISYCKKNVS